MQFNSSKTRVVNIQKKITKTANANGEGQVGKGNVYCFR